jgi:hypothetical protein
MFELAQGDLLDLGRSAAWFATTRAGAGPRSGLAELCELLRALRQCVAAFRASAAGFIFALDERPTPEEVKEAALSPRQVNLTELLREIPRAPGS